MNQSAANRSYYARHTEEEKIRAKTRYWNNRSAVRDQQLRSRLKNRYGITIEFYTAMRTHQQERCAICRRHESEFKKGLAVDHDHKTGRVRGLLCNGCNRGLGFFSDTQETVQNAADYLRSKLWTF